MRTGGCTVQQTLTTEAASAVKQSLTLAKRRGHAQVTPLHVAATLLSSSTSLLRRGCLSSHHPSSHPLQTRALELCFNVALNRLPTLSPPPHLPSLSNALVAALKRAQAHQRRGSIEQQQQQQQQQCSQPVLTVKVELEQLIISILDDPSVSRVMREAGFSSTCVKNNIEEDSNASLAYSPLPVEDDSTDDLRLVVEVLLSKNKRKNNAVVVSDSVLNTELVVSELKTRVGRHDVPEELKGTQFINFHFSPIQLMFVSISDIDLNLIELKRKVRSSASERRNVIICLGDLRWAVEGEETREVVNHIISEITKLVAEWRCLEGFIKVWLMGSASYETHMRCQMRKPSLELQWGLQAVDVPSGGLALSLHVPSDQSPKVKTTSISKNPFMTWETKPLFCSDEKEKLVCCAECTANFEKESSSLRSNNLPSWLQPYKPQNHQEDVRFELRRKWNSSCQSLHHKRHNTIQVHNPFYSTTLVNHRYNNGSLHHLLSNTTPTKQSNMLSPVDSPTRSVVGTSNLLDQSRSDKKESLFWGNQEPNRWLSEGGLSEVGTTLALGCIRSESSTSLDRTQGGKDFVELRRKLKDNISWQYEKIRSIADTLVDRKTDGKGMWMVIKGTDTIGKQRLPMVIAEFVSGTDVTLVRINARKSEHKFKTNIELLMEGLERNVSCVISIEEMDYADVNFLKFLCEGSKTGLFKDSSGKTVSAGESIFVLSTASAGGNGENTNKVINMKMQEEATKDDIFVAENVKRKPDPLSPNKSKCPRKCETFLDLNLTIHDPEDDEDNNNVSSDITHELDDPELSSPHEFLDGISTSFVLDYHPNQTHCLSEHYLSRLRIASDETGSSLDVDAVVIEELVAASGSFTGARFDKWLEEVFKKHLPTFKKGGKVRLSVEGRIGNIWGFEGSCLPNRMLL